MRKPLALNLTGQASRQQGFALFIVLLMMIVISLLIVAALQSYNTEQHISTNDADRKLASSLAEAALREGERAVFDIADNGGRFTPDCNRGLCTALNVPAGKYATALGDIEVSGKVSKNPWLPGSCGNPDTDSDTESEENSQAGVNDGSCLSKKGSVFKTKPLAANDARYIIEFLGTQSGGRSIYRITAVAWGRNPNTSVILQSYAANHF